MSGYSTADGLAVSPQTNTTKMPPFRIDVFNNGKSIIDIIAQDRDAISFDGEMVF